MDYHLILLAFAVLFAIARFIYRSIKWIARQSKGTAAGPNPIQQALADAQRPPTPTRAAPARLSTASPPLTAATPPVLARQPSAGGPAVPREATGRDFEQREWELAASEPSALSVSLQSSAPAVLPATPNLFRDTDDLIRAFILKEALGPPLSRRSSRRPPS